MCNEELGGKAQVRAKNGLGEQHQAAKKVLNMRKVFPLQLKKKKATILYPLKVGLAKVTVLL